MSIRNELLEQILLAIGSGSVSSINVEQQSLGIFSSQASQSPTGLGHANTASLDILKTVVV